MLAIFVLVFSICNISYASNSSESTTDIVNESSCLIGYDCSNCPLDRIDVIETKGVSIKVCCPNCGPNLITRWNPNGNPQGNALCRCPVYEGNCWTGQQCEECFHGPNRSYVGFVDGLYLCCPNCQRSSKSVEHEGESHNKCNCLKKDDVTKDDVTETAKGQENPHEWRHIKDPKARMEHLLKDFKRILDQNEQINKDIEWASKMKEIQKMHTSMNIRPVNHFTNEKHKMYDYTDDYDEDDDDDDDFYDDDYYDNDGDDEDFLDDEQYDD